MKSLIVGALLLSAAGTPRTSAADPAPLRLAIARLSHDHVHWIFNRPGKNDVELVGIFEPDEELRARFAERYALDSSLFYTDLDVMLEAVRPEAVAAFGSIYEHLEVVEAAAPLGIHVMVEKPLAVSVDHALRMQELAEDHGIDLITNYETTWYASTHAAKEILARGDVGPIRKIIVRDGHEGPKEIGVSDEFLDWLTDPKLNGGGALIDFGCYGANLATWLMGGALPQTVTAVTQQIKPDVYPNVDDDATIILTYPQAQAVIQASWNWPFSRKDMHVYGASGYVSAPDAGRLLVRRAGETQESEMTLTGREEPLDDPFTYFAAVVRGGVAVDGSDLSSLSTNVKVVRILDAARRSAETGETVFLGD